MPKLKDKPEDSEDDLAAIMFRALGDATRLRIFNLLRTRAALETAMGQLEVSQEIPAGVVQLVSSDGEVPLSLPVVKEGKGGKAKSKPVSVGAVPVGEICLYITGEKKFTSAISHHLKELRHAGLINVERCGKQKLCHINEQAVEALSGYLALRSE